MQVEIGEGSATFALDVVRVRFARDVLRQSRRPVGMHMQRDDEPLNCLIALPDRTDMLLHRLGPIYIQDSQR